MTLSSFSFIFFAIKSVEYHWNETKRSVSIASTSFPFDLPRTLDIGSFVVVFYNFRASHSIFSSQKRSFIQYRHNTKWQCAFIRYALYLHCDSYYDNFLVFKKLNNLRRFEMLCGAYCTKLLFQYCSSGGNRNLALNWTQYLFHMEQSCETH